VKVDVQCDEDVIKARRTSKTKRKRST